MNQRTISKFSEAETCRRRQRRKRLRKKDADADNVPEKTVNSFYCFGIKKKIPQIKSSHAIDVGLQFLQVD